MSDEYRTAWDVFGVTFDTMRREDLIAFMLEITDQRNLATSCIDEEKYIDALQKEKK